MDVRTRYVDGKAKKSVLVHDKARQLPNFRFCETTTLIGTVIKPVFKIPGSGFILVASEYPSMTNMEIIQYTNVLFTQAPIHVCPHGTNIDSRTTLVTMYYCG